MSEYWISQPRKFCEFCKCWIADNRPSRDFHEKGKRHQENVKKKIADVMKKGIAHQAKEQEMSDSLKEMEENALKAFKKDLMGNPSLAEQYGVKLKSKEEKKKEEEIVYTVENRPESFEDTEEPEEEQAEEASRTTEATSNVGPWYTAQSPEGYTYYWHDVTGEVSWVPPPGYNAQQKGESNANTVPSDKSEPIRLAKSSRQSAHQAKEFTEDGPEDKTDEPETKKLKVDEPEVPPRLPHPSEIPLPEDIPLPPEKSDEKDTESPEEKEEMDEDQIEQVRDKRRPKSHQSYGSWETVEEPEPVPVDFQLPVVAPTILPHEPIIPTHEPKLKFREKTVSSLGSGPVFFKKRKKTMTAAQFLKKREEQS